MKYNTTKGRSEKNSRPKIGQRFWPNRLIMMRLIRSSNLPDGAARLYEAIVDRCADNPYCFAGVKVLAGDTGSTQRSVERNLAILEAEKCIETERLRREAARRHCLYHAINETHDSTGPKYPSYLEYPEDLRSATSGGSRSRSATFGIQDPPLLVGCESAKSDLTPMVSDTSGDLPAAEDAREEAKQNLEAANSIRFTAAELEVIRAGTLSWLDLTYVQAAGASTPTGAIYQHWYRDLYVPLTKVISKTHDIPGWAPTESEFTEIAARHFGLTPTEENLGDGRYMPVFTGIRFKDAED